MAGTIIDQVRLEKLVMRTATPTKNPYYICSLQLAVSSACHLLQISLLYFLRERFPVLNSRCKDGGWSLETADTPAVEELAIQCEWIA